MPTFFFLFFKTKMIILLDHLMNNWPVTEIMNASIFWIKRQSRN